jgi:hypothetical protein
VSVRTAVRTAARAARLEPDPFVWAHESSSRCAV